jgi:hypothetical protein
LGVTVTARVPSMRRIQPLAKEREQSAAPTDGASQVRSALAPVEARAAQHAARAGAACNHRVNIDAEPVQELHAGVCHQSSVFRQLHLAAGNERVRQRHAEAAGQVVVAGAGRAQRNIAWSDRELVLAGLWARGHQHDALHHLRHGQ